MVGHDNILYGYEIYPGSTATIVAERETRRAYDPVLLNRSWKANERNWDPFSGNMWNMSI